MRDDYTLVIVDGDGFAKAAYSAAGARQLAHRFLSRVFALRRDLPAARLAVAWDRPDSADGRLERFRGYKASRRGKPSRFGDDYLAEVRRVRAALATLGVASLSAPGWEADDAIATVVRRNRGRSLVLTRDRDLLQLVNQRVDVLLRVGSEDEVLTVAEASERLGVPVGLYRDWKALAGDAGDDVPGVRGVGPKGATALLAWNPKLVAEVSALGRSESAATPEVSHALERVLEFGRENLRTQRFLVTLHDVELEVERGRFDRAAAAELLEASGLRTLRDRLDGWREPRRRRRIRRLRSGSGSADELSARLGVEMTKVESTNLRAVGVSVDGEDLIVVFHRGEVYEYPGAGHLLGDLLAAESKGRFFSKNVRSLAFVKRDPAPG